MLRDVSKDHQKGKHTVQVLRQISLEIFPGEFVAIMGASGAGKTTLLNIMGGLDNPNAGTVKINGVNIDKLSGSQLAAWRSSNVGFIFQFYNLISVLTARQNVELPLTLTSYKKQERSQRCEAVLKLVGLLDRANHYPNEMSGGEQQRVAIARAIITSPQILLCDEPTGDLDRENAIQILHLLKMLCEEFGKTIIMVTHDHKAAQFADRCIHLDSGNIVDHDQVESDALSKIHNS